MIEVLGNEIFDTKINRYAALKDIFGRLCTRQFNARCLHDYARMGLQHVSNRKPKVS